MKNIHLEFHKGRWWFDFKVLRFDLEKARKSGELDVLFGIGMGLGMFPDSFSLNKRLFFVFDWPAFGVGEATYNSPIHLGIK